MSTARKFNHEDLYKKLDALELSKTQLLSDLILSSNTSDIDGIIYWESKKLKADADGVAICNNQIDILERNMMAKAIIIEDLLGSTELTGGIPTVMEAKVIEETTVEETSTTKEETPVLDIKTGKAVKEKVIESKEEVAIETVTETVKEEGTVVTERKPLDVIKKEVTELIQAGKKDEGYALYAAYMKKGMWLNGKGKAGNAWNDKELKNAWSALLKKVEIAVVENHVEKTETVATESKAEPVAKEVETTTSEVVEKTAIDFEKAKLVSDENNLKTYKKFYPNDTEAEKNVLTFTKSNRNVGEEEKSLENVYNDVCTLIANNQMNDAAELTRLFFSERAYDDSQVGKWLTAASANTNIKNQLAFLTEAITLQPADSIEAIVTMATEAVKKDKVAKPTLMAWFRSNVLGKKLTDVDKVINDEESLLAKFNATLAWLWESKPTHTPTALIRVTEVLTERLKELNAKDHTMLDVIKTAQDKLKGEGFTFTLKELKPKAEELAKTANPELLKAYQNRKNFLGQPVGPTKVAEPVVTDIKPNAEFEKGETLKENPTSDSPGKEEITPSSTGEVETVEAVIEFKTMDDLMFHLKSYHKETNDKNKVMDEALKYMVTLNCIEDAKDWTGEQVGLMVDGLLNPAEEIVGETSPASESGEAVATVTENAAPVVTEEAAVKENKEENTSSSTTKSLEIDLKGVAKANNKNQLDEAIKVAYTNNDKKLSDELFIAEVISVMKAESSTKFVRNFGKNKIEQLTASINKVIAPKLK